MKYEVDTYELEYDKKSNKYFISFKDSVGKECKLEIRKEIFDAYMKSKREYKKIQNQYDRHEEHLSLSDINLYKRSFKNEISLEDMVIQKISNNELRKVVKELPEIHRRRLEMYFFKDMSVKEIATKEDKDERTIRYSISKGIDEIAKKLKNVYAKLKMIQIIIENRSS